MKKTDFLQYKQTDLTEVLKKDARPSMLEFLPGAYPFWERHCALSGMTWIDFDPTIGDGDRNDVRIDLTDSGFNFTQTPLILTWFRDSATSLAYSDTTKIFKFPLVRRNASGTVLESFSTSFFSDTNELYFVRHGVTAYSGPGRVYIKFYLFKDDTFLNSDLQAGFTTL